MTEQASEQLNDNDVCRTAPANPGLLKKGIVALNNGCCSNMKTSL